MKKKVDPKLQQEVKVDIITSDGIKIYYTGKFQDFTARYIINMCNMKTLSHTIRKLWPLLTLSQMKNFRYFRNERFTDDNSQFDENGRGVSKKVENTGERRNCLL